MSLPSRLMSGSAERNLVVAFRHAAFVELLSHVVDTLALEEDHRVGSLQRGVHQTLRVIRSNREHDFQAGNVSRERGPVLRVLSAVFRSDRNADYDRHFQNVAAHGLPLGQLVEHLVAAAAEEVAVHDLGESRDRRTWRIRSPCR